MTASSRIVAFGLFSLPFAAAGAAQEWPSKPIAIVTTGSADAAPRIVGEEVARTLGQRFLMDSHPGASGTIAAEYTLRQPAEGYVYTTRLDDSHIETWIRTSLAVGAIPESLSADGATLK
jgi:tripartite-type tricarboxylate transporter receptor subunit TctC